MRRSLLLLAVAGVAWAQSLDQGEALRQQRRFEEANNEFRALVAKSPDKPEYRVAWGRLFLERFNKAEAAQLFQEALEIRKDYAPALLGLALVAAEGFEQKAVEMATKAIELDPKLIEARELLARLALEDSDYGKARDQARKAVDASPKALRAMAVLGTADLLEGKQGEEWFERIAKTDPRFGGGWAIAANVFVLNRRYEEAIGFYRKALAIDPAQWETRSQLGIQLMRLGQEKEAREHLESCYNNNHRDDATVNTLRLMDSYKNFETFTTPTTVLKLHKKEAALLHPYFQSELERCIRTYEKKYQLKLDRPVQLEVYPDHEDFAVRTMGMPGLGALGVTFGTVVAMDSPSGRKPGSFHWASTLWHEMSHVFVLTATGHKVPRWFTEGMAVFEETATEPDWGDRLDPETINAVKSKKLLPVAELDRGFVRPSYPNQVIVSYFQAGRICDYINRRWGYGKLLEMMRDFPSGRSTAEVVERALHMKPESFDKEFLADLDNQLGTVVKNFDEWRKKMKPLAEAAKAKRYDDVVRDGPAVRDLFPDYVEASSAYELLADAYTARNDKAGAARELSLYAKQGGRNPASLKQLAALLREAGEPAKAAAVLEKLNLIYLHDGDAHQQLGELSLALNRPPPAVREFRAVLSAKPADPAAAHFNLARALRAANQKAEAQEELLLSLEIAPGFKAAQRMLLELTRE